MTDRELLEKLHSDPNAGLTELVGSFGALVGAVVRGVLRGFSSFETDECISDVFTRFYFEKDKVDLAKGGIAAYLCVMAKHDALDIARRRAAEGRHIVPVEDDADLADECSLEETVIGSETRRELIAAVKALGEPDGEIIIRRYYLCQSGKEIAEKLGMTEGNVNVRIYRALRRLRSAIGGGD